MNCPKCLNPVMMKDSTVSGGVYFHSECAPPTPPDPIVETAKEALRQALGALEDRGKRYNNCEYQYKDFMTSPQTALDRIAEPLLRLRNSREFSQLVDTLGYTALGGGYFLGGSPKSKINIPPIEGD